MIYHTLMASQSYDFSVVKHLRRAEPTKIVTLMTQFMLSEAPVMKCEEMFELVEANVVATKETAVGLTELLALILGKKKFGNYIFSEVEEIDQGVNFKYFSQAGARFDDRRKEGLYVGGEGSIAMQGLSFGKERLAEAELKVGFQVSPELFDDFDSGNPSLVYNGLSADLMNQIAQTLNSNPYSIGEALYEALLSLSMRRTEFEMISTEVSGISGNKQLSEKFVFLK